MIKLKLLLLSSLLLGLVACGGSGSGSDKNNLNCGTLLVNLTFVDKDNTSGIEDGSFENPFNTIAEGLANLGTSRELFILSADSPYSGSFTIENGVAVYGEGAFYESPAELIEDAPETLGRSCELFAGREYPQIDGAAMGPIFTLEGNNTVQGIEFIHSSDTEGLTAETFMSVSAESVSVDTTRTALLANAVDLGNMEINGNVMENMRSAIVMAFTQGDFIFSNNNVSSAATDGDNILIFAYGSGDSSFDFSNNVFDIDVVNIVDGYEIFAYDDAEVVFNSTDNVLTTNSQTDSGDGYDTLVADNASLVMVHTNDEITTTGDSGPDGFDPAVNDSGRHSITLDNVRLQQFSENGGPDGIDWSASGNSRFTVNVINGTVFESTGFSSANDSFDGSTSDNAIAEYTIQNSAFTVLPTGAPGSRSGNIFDDSYDDNSQVSISIENSTFSTGDPSESIAPPYVFNILSSENTALTFNIDNSEIRSTGEGVYFRTEDNTTLAIDVNDTLIEADTTALEFDFSDTPTLSANLSDNSVTSVSAGALVIVAPTTASCFDIQGNSFASANLFDDIVLSSTLSVAAFTNLSANNNGASVDSAGAAVTNVTSCP